MQCTPISTFEINIQEAITFYLELNSHIYTHLSKITTGKKSASGALNSSFYISGTKTETLSFSQYLNEVVTNQIHHLSCRQTLMPHGKS